MKLRPFLPAVAVASALAVTTSAYQLTFHTDTPPQQPVAERGAERPAVAAVVRSAARDLVAREVIAGRTTVPEAAALFAWLDALPPPPVSVRPDQLAVQAGLPDSGGYTQAEMLGVRVVVFVEAATRSWPPSPPGCVERARGEFLAARARGEFVRLPAIPEDRCATLLEQARAEAQSLMVAHPTARRVRTAE